MAEAKEITYPFYWRGAPGWGATYSGYSFQIVHGRDLLIYDHNGRRVHDQRFENEQAAKDEAYRWACAYLGAPLPK